MWGPRGRIINFVCPRLGVALQTEGDAAVTQVTAFVAQLEKTLSDDLAAHAEDLHRAIEAQVSHLGHLQSSVEGYGDVISREFEQKVETLMNAAREAADIVGEHTARATRQARPRRCPPPPPHTPPPPPAPHPTAPAPHHPPPPAHRPRTRPAPPAD